MFILSDRVLKRRDELLRSTLQEILLAFAKRQDQAIKCFLPLDNLELKDIADGCFSTEEKRYLVLQLQLRGFIVSFRNDVTPSFRTRSYSMPERRSTTMSVVSGIYNDAQSDEDDSGSSNVDRATYECLTACQWKSQQQDFAFSWLFGSLNERVLACSRGRDLFDFELSLSPVQDSKFVCSEEAKQQQRTSVFRRPLLWANRMTCYNLEYCDKSDCVKVTYKPPSEVEQAILCTNTLLFSSLLWVDRIRDSHGVDWRRLPLTAFRSVFCFLIGRDVSKSGIRDADAARRARERNHQSSSLRLPSGGQVEVPTA